jgi:hypothetical protein
VERQRLDARGGTPQLVGEPLAVGRRRAELLEERLLE